MDEQPKTLVGDTAAGVEMRQNTDGEILPNIATKGRRKRTNATRLVIEWGVLIIGAVLLALVIRGTLVQAFYIPSESMEPTLHGCRACNNNDRILVNKLAYKFGDPDRGDIVVFSSPPASVDKSIRDLVKRIIALPGEKIEARNNAIYITKVGESEPQKLEEPYINPACKEAVAANLTAQTLQPGYYFMMGDNRCASSDSRVFGPVKGSTFVGRAFVRVWPVSRFKIL